MNEKVVDILKSAILIEKRGVSFYSSVAKHTENSEVKRIFSILAEEEKQHEKALSDLYQQKDKNYSDMTFTLKNTPHNLIDEIQTEKIINSINSASFEGAAIAAGIDMEKQSIDVYSAKAEKSENNEEKAFYQKLADWEKTHLDLLNYLDEELKKRIWFDNSFWPF